MAVLGLSIGCLLTPVPVLLPQWAAAYRHVRPKGRQQLPTHKTGGRVEAGLQPPVLGLYHPDATAKQSLCLRLIGDWLGLPPSAHRNSEVI